MDSAGRNLSAELGAEAGGEQVSETKKSVRVRIWFERDISVPEYWDANMIQFWLNGSAHCLMNELRAEVAEAEKDPGRCDFCWRAGGEVASNQEAN